MTGQPFVPEGNRNRQDRQDGLGPGPGQGGLGPLLAGRFERQSDDEFGDTVGFDECLQSGRIRVRVAAAPERHQGSSRGLGVLRQCDPDPLLPEVHAEQSGHGLGLASGEASGPSAMVSSTRFSKVGIVVTQPGERSMTAVP